MIRSRNTFRRGVAALIPSDIDELEGWWDASDPTTLFDQTSGGSLTGVGGNVNRWEDKSGNGRHGIRGNTVGTFIPTRQTSVQNGLDVIRKNGRAHYTTSLDFRIDNVDIFLVWNKTGNPTNQFTDFNVVIGGSATNISGGSGRWNMLTTSDENKNCQVRSNQDFFSTTVAFNQPLPSGAELIRLRGSPTQIGGALNGASLDLQNHELTPATNVGNFRFGDGTATAHDFSSRADYMEIFIFSRHLTAEEDEGLRQYVFTKWGITP